MSAIYLSPNEILEIKKLPKVPGRAGDYGQCYFYEDGNNPKRIFKLFYPPVKKT